MSQCQKISRIDMLTNAIARLNSLLEVEQVNSGKKVRTSKPGVEKNVVCGLSTLFSSVDMIPPIITTPYVNFANGVCIGADPSDDSWVVVEFTPATCGDNPISEIVPCSPLLSVHPVMQIGHVVPYVTIETEIQFSGVKFGKRISFDLISNFEFLDSRQSCHTNTVKMSLRQTHNDGTYSDIEFSHIPVTTMPMFNTFSFVLPHITKEKIDSDSKFKLIFWLPTHGSYTFKIYSLSARVVS